MSFISFKFQRIFDKTHFLMKLFNLITFFSVHLLENKCKVLCYKCCASNSNNHRTKVKHTSILNNKGVWVLIYSTRKLILYDQNIKHIKSDDTILCDGENSYFRPRIMRELLKIPMCVIRFLSRKNEMWACFCGPKNPTSLP